MKQIFSTVILSLTVASAAHAGMGSNILKSTVKTTGSELLILDSEALRLATKFQDEIQATRLAVLDNASNRLRLGNSYRESFISERQLRSGILEDGSEFKLSVSSSSVETVGGEINSSLRFSTNSTDNNVIREVYHLLKDPSRSAFIGAGQNGERVIVASINNHDIASVKRRLLQLNIKLNDGTLGKTIKSSLSKKSITSK